MSDFFNSLLDKIDWIIVLIVLCAGFFQSRYIKGLNISKDPSYNAAIKTLGLSFVASVVYILLAKNPNEATNWAKYFISYFFATSLYELLISKFVDWLNTVSGGKINIKGDDAKP